MSSSGSSDPIRPNPATTSALDDAGVVARVQTGDLAALESLVRAWASPLIAFTGALLRSPHDAEEVVQDLFVWIWEHRFEWEVQGPLGAYLYRAARNRAVSRMRHQQVEAGRQGEVVASATGHTTDRIVAAFERLDLKVGCSGREMDRALATGEALSSALLAGRLCELGIRAVSLSGGEAGIEADGPFGSGTITGTDPGPIRRLLRRGQVPVVAGFQGQRSDGQTLTLGRVPRTRPPWRSPPAEGLCRAVPPGHRRRRRLRAGSYSRLIRQAARGAHLCRAAGPGPRRARVVHPVAGRVALVHGVPL